ncbi:unnamed protein product [Amoebophrya sp. A25]|nr:unnamed protein product [Amoebophrya sp. A25]|eukprot:GSA25T00013490001.1
MKYAIEDAPGGSAGAENSRELQGSSTAIASGPGAARKQDDVWRQTIGDILTAVGLNKEKFMFEVGASEIAACKIALGTFILYLACLIPIIVMSCITTATCDVGDILGPTDYCAEHGPGEKPVLTSGSECMIKCGGKIPGKQYYEPVLECDDGNLVDASSGSVVGAICYELQTSIWQGLTEAQAIAQFADANSPQNVLLTGQCVGATEREVPNINAAVPCVEGKFIKPGKSCTVNCASGYFPTVTTQECRRPEMLLFPVHSTIQCLLGSQITAWRAEMRAKPCFRDTHCNGHGIATRNQTTLACDCACDLSFAGKSCELEVRECLLPEIENAGKPPCTEGYTTYVRGPTCTINCDTDYFPSFPVMRCTGTTLSPPKVECRGGPMPPTVCLVGSVAVSGSYVLFLIVLFCLYKWRNWQVKKNMTKIYAGDIKCTMTAIENHASGGQTNVLVPSQSAREFDRKRREKYPIFRTNPETGEIQFGSELHKSENWKSDEFARAEVERLSRLTDLQRTQIKEVPLIESAYMSAYEGFLVEENYDRASKLINEGYLLDAEVDALAEDEVMDDVRRKAAIEQEEEFAKRNPVFQTHDGTPDTLLLMAPTDQRYAVDHAGQPIRDPMHGGTDLNYEGPVVEQSVVPSLVEQAAWLNDFNKTDNEKRSEQLQKESVLEILARYEGSTKLEKMAVYELEAAQDVLVRAKAIADDIDCWPLNKRCRIAMKKVAEAQEVAQQDLDDAITMLTVAVASKEGAKIEEAIAGTMQIHGKYPAIIGRWHMVGREVITTQTRRAARNKADMEKLQKRRMGLTADFDLGPKDIIQAVLDKDVAKVRAALNAFVSPNTRCPDSGLCLIHLCMNSYSFHPEVTFLLVQRKADPKMLTNDQKDIWDLAPAQVRQWLCKKLRLKIPPGRTFEDEEEVAPLPARRTSGTSATGGASSRGGGSPKGKTSRGSSPDDKSPTDAKSSPKNR